MNAYIYIKIIINLNCIIRVCSGGLLPQALVFASFRYQSFYKMMFDMFDNFDIVENNHQQLIKNVAGETQDPSRKMRLENHC